MISEKKYDFEHFARVPSAAPRHQTFILFYMTVRQGSQHPPLVLLSERLKVERLHLVRVSDVGRVANVVGPHHDFFRAQNLSEEFPPTLPHEFSVETIWKM